MWDGLNPCCSGRWSRTYANVNNEQKAQSLNPCCSGRWSRTTRQIKLSRSTQPVLILVVVEDGLVQKRLLKVIVFYLRVLILVVVEDGLVRTRQGFILSLFCLNPCCSGRWSRTYEEDYKGMWEK